MFLALRYSPCYRSEEDNDPLTDSSSAYDCAFTVVPHTKGLHGTKSSAKTGRHHLASSILSDDGNDSQTYYGDVESKSSLHQHRRRSSSVSTLTSQINEDPSERRFENSGEPPSIVNPTIPFNPATLTPEAIQAFVRKAIQGEPRRLYHINPPPEGRPVRVFADGR